MGYNTASMLSSVPGEATAVLAATQALPFGVAIADPQGTVTWANVVYAQLSSCTPAELIGQSAGDFDWNALAHAAPGSEPWRYQATRGRKTGEVCSVEHSITTLRGPAQEIAGFWITQRDTTGLKRPAGTLSQAEANLTALIESTEDLIGSFDLEYALLTFNNAFRESIKATVGRQAAVGMRLEEWLPPERYALWPPMFDRAVSEGPFRTEYTLLDGRTLELSFNPILQDDRAAGVSFFGKDITERKAAEKALREAESKYRNIFAGALEGIFRTSIEGKALTANPALAKMLGYDSPEEDVPSISDVALQVWLDQNERSRFLKLLQDQGVVLGYDCQLKRKDGMAVWVSVNSRIVTDVDGKPLYIEGFIEDITERKRAEAAIEKASRTIAETELHYRLMFNSVSDAVFVHRIQADGLPSRFFDVNDNACRLLGYTREELLRMRVVDIIAPEERFSVSANAERLQANGHAIWSGQLATKDGRRIPVEVHARVFDLDGLPTIISSVRDVSERKDAERQYRDIFERANEGIYRISLEGKVLAANPALATMLGYDSPEEVVSTVTDSAHQAWADPKERAKFLQLLEKHGTVRGYECQHKRKDGTTIWVSLSSRVVYGPDGRALYSDGFVQDVTERRWMQDALRKSEETLARLFRSSPSATMLFKLVDTEYRIADVNEAFEQSTGYRRNEAIGRTIEELGLWPDPSEGIEYLKRFRSTGRVRGFEHRFRRKNGDIGVCLSSAESIDIDGLPCAIAATSDITKQKQVEDTMRSLVTAIEQSVDTIVITDLSGVIQYCNPAFEKVTGYSKEEAIGQNPRILKSGKHTKEVYEQLWATIKQGSVWTGRLINKKKDGSFSEEDATISPIRDSSGKISGYVAIERDVTERLQLEDQLRQAQKLESIGRLAGGVAHDFNNLLTVINGYSGFLLKGLKAGDPLRAYADEIKTAGNRAASLTKQLLAFSRKQVIEPRTIDLNTTIRQSAPMLQRLIGEDVALETHLDDCLGKVRADPDQIHQVIINLAVNARDAMPDGGRLAIETKNVELGTEDSPAMRPDTMPGMYVSMTVTDNGKGMDEAIRRQIFEPFFTTKEAGKGTGLGLATVYGIIRQSGGWIDVTSEVGVGTSFDVFLPRIDGRAEPERDGICGPTNVGVETILVVEDQKSVRTFAVAALQQHGYHVLEASDGNEAIAVAARQPGQLHLLLTDVVMPGMNGKELSDRLKEVRPNLKVLFISGYTADVIAHRGVLDPGVAFLQKPFSPDELAQKVREVLAAL